MQRHLLNLVLTTGAYGFTRIDMGPLLMNKNIDPIVFSGSYNSSHLHTFFGSSAITATTNSSAGLRAGHCTTTNNPNDFSAYWLPTLLSVDNGVYTPVPVKRFVVYYNEDLTEAEMAFPEDFRMVAGNAKANSTDVLSTKPLLTWFCTNESFTADGKNLADFPMATCLDGRLEVTLKFPQCANPDTLEYGYSSGGSCASGFKTIPQLRFAMTYNVSSYSWGADDIPFVLSSGPSYTFHGDFFNGWMPDVLDIMATTLTSPKNEQNLDGTLGKMFTYTDCNKVDADPTRGTSDYLTSVALRQGTSAASNSSTAASSTPISASSTASIANAISAPASSSAKAVATKLHDVVLLAAPSSSIAHNAAGSGTCLRHRKRGHALH